MKKIDKEWFKAALVRALKTIAQVMIGMITVGAAIYEVDWLYIVSVAVVSGIVSILTSIAGLPETSTDGTLQMDGETGDYVMTSIRDDEFKPGTIAKFKVK